MGPHDPRTLGYVMQVHCPGAGDDGEMTVVDHVKLFRNHPAIRFEGWIHEPVLPSIRRLASVDSLGNCTTTVYDDVGRLETSVNALNHCTELSYDAAGNLSQKYNLKSDDSVISGFTYASDAVGNRTGVQEASGDHVTWAYDATYQLTGEDRSGASAYSHANEYDPVGNRLVKDADAALTSYAYDAANQLVTAQDGMGVATYTFDAAGNQRLVQIPGGDLTTYDWDYENQNTRLELADGAVATYTYNADNRRVREET